MNQTSVNRNQWIPALMGLCKFKITFAVATTTVAGYILGNGSLDAGIILPTLALWLVASGSAALNHFQEHPYDREMARTSVRPIPAGLMSPGTVLTVAFLLISTGSLGLYYSSNATSGALGVLAVFWYNGFYTPMKRKSAYTVIPGGLIGAIPPMIGYAVANQSVLHPEILSFCFFIFIWQVPHFWLLSMFYGEQYSNAGFPCMTRQFEEEKVKRIVFSWIVACAFSSLLIPMFGGGSHPVTWTGIVVLSTWCVVEQKQLLKQDKTPYKKAFMLLNLFALLVMVLIALDELLVSI